MGEHSKTLSNSSKRDNNRFSPDVERSDLLERVRSSLYNTLFYILLNRRF